MRLKLGLFLRWKLLHLWLSELNCHCLVSEPTPFQIREIERVWWMRVLLFVPSRKAPNHCEILIAKTMPHSHSWGMEQNWVHASTRPYQFLKSGKGLTPKTSTMPWLQERSASRSTDKNDVRHQLKCSLLPRSPKLILEKCEALGGEARASIRMYVTYIHTYRQTDRHSSRPTY